MLEKLKRRFLYAMLDQKQFHKVKPMVDKENASALRFAAIVQIIYFGMSFISSMGVEEMADKRLVYGIGTILPIIVLAVQFFFSKKFPKVISWLIGCTSAGLLVTGLLCTLICTPDEMTILLLIFFFCIPMLFIVRPIELVTTVVVIDIFYFAFAPFLKAPAVLTIDMLDVGIFSTLSMILGTNHMIERYRRYWLESQAVDLAEVRYQAAYLDQLTGTYNRNAYNKDVEELEQSGRPLDFMFVAMDINGLKAANDTFGHVAGDELICGAADCMKKCFDSYGKVYRVGGDEFNAILKTNGVSAGKILDLFNETMTGWKGTLLNKMAISYGVVLADESKSLSFHEIELLADKRMYQAKSDYYKESGIERRKN